VTFSSEWSHFEYRDRTWAKPVRERAELFLKEVGCGPEEMYGKTVLDAGCGNGSLSRAISQLGCEVLAADLSDSVDRAYRHFSELGNDRTHFIKADLTRHPFAEQAFDIIYSSGVLHHNPNTRAAFASLLPALKPKGKVYIWVYQRIPGLRHALKQILRRFLAPLPSPIKHAFVCLWLPQAMCRQYLRTALGRNGPEDRLRWRERLVLLLDHYTPRYRWEHTQEEVHAWYRELGLTDVATTEVREWGFGVVGRKPPADVVRRAELEDTAACAE
jgi:2-polyprenyl-3-methyl-5-hydroxy-6-metoxy-1,4-benzoquinol methylase